MGFLDKLKNAFFEEEEVEEAPVKLAKKIELPKRKSVQEQPSLTKEVIKQPIMEEKSVKKEDVLIEEPVEENIEIENKKIPMVFDEEDFFEDTSNFSTRESRLEKKELYQGKKDTIHNETSSKTPSYSYTNTHYESKEVKGFRPSPIISPIYGILDKNYKKEEVITRKEIRVTSSNYGKFDLDTVRDKAFGTDTSSDKPLKTTKKKEEKAIYDVNSSKPTVERVTLADADEYYNDLGLAYNVDYNDESKVSSNTRTKRYHEDHVEHKDEDNLFDLIESMYEKEE